MAELGGMLATVVRSMFIYASEDDWSTSIGVSWASVCIGRYKELLAFRTYAAAIG
jgi:hypothetical protein